MTASRVEAVRNPVRAAFWRGARDGAPFLLVVTPFSLLFGVMAAESGLTLTQAMGFNFIVVAGASQFIAVSLMADDAPALVVMATALAVNLRMAMYSAALVPHLGAAPLWQRALIAYMNTDQTYTVSVLEYEKRPEMPLAEKVTYFVGAAAPVLAAWYAFALVGVLVGASIPPAFALDFALPITFVALITPMLRTLAHVAAAVTSIVVALSLTWVPSGLGLLIAAACAMVVGALFETWSERRR
ncbi:AzlC family ABC transporter permease [Oceaniglobus indicus]|uniref:AzlC family ABC transporter permease n=1 Tax=Oceaniglobus indicus TaxID=2047749 RepID=UPI000C18089D|nr:AzlC family ABC transporter permease [Oceaniglobus indicus]